MSYLEVSGARLYFEVHGHGPCLVLVHGANGSGSIFRRLADQLSSRYQVVSYDRRGFSRSDLSEPPDPVRRLEQDAHDLSQLVTQVGGASASVFGTSSGGLVALEALVRYPQLISTLVAFEPAAFKLLPDSALWLEFFASIYDRYRAQGPESALDEFRRKTFPQADRALMARAMNLADAAVQFNASYWLENELRQYTAADLDLEALRILSDRVVPAVGAQSRGFPTYRIGVELGAALAQPVVELPGGQTGSVAPGARYGGPGSGTGTRHSMRRSVVIVAMHWALFLSGTALAIERPLVGKPIHEVLTEARAEGIAIVFNTELVPETLVVKAEPQQTATLAVLMEILRPYGLTLAPFGKGVYSVTRS